MKLEPLLLEPQFVHRIWGARSLAPQFPEKSNLTEAIGEVWLTGNLCRIMNGEFAGRALADAWRSMSVEWAGTQMNTRAAFPLLVKFLFPAEKLSVQVHPDDDYARRHEGGSAGKTECWHVIAAQPGAEVLVGLDPHVTPKTFRSAIADGTAERCLRRIPVHAGDTIFVPAGTMHTIGPGLVLCEIQENSNVTYRVFDYNRVDASGKPRELHIEKALDVARFGEQLGGKVEPVRMPSAGCTKTRCISCPYFTVEKWEFERRLVAATDPQRFELLIILEGSGKLESSGGPSEFSRGQVWLLPAALGEFQLAPAAATSLLRAYVPTLGEIQ